MKSKSKILSVILIYNQQEATSLEKSLENISSQSKYDAIDIIIIDTIGSLSREDILLKSVKVNLISGIGLSYFEALNIGVSESSTEWVNILKLGNIYSSSTIIEEVISIIANNDADVYYGDSLKVINNELNRYEIMNAKSVEGVCNEEVFCFESCILKANILRLYKFNTFYKYAAEYDLLIRLFKGNISFVYLSLAISKSSFSKSFSERIERLFIISKYFGDEALTNSIYFKPFIRLSYNEANRVRRHIRNIDIQLSEQESILQERSKEFNEIQKTLTYKFGRVIYALLSFLSWSRR